MKRAKLIKYLFIITVFVIAGFATADSLGFFKTKTYTAVNHGSHYHYVPDNRNPDVGLDKFPSKEPAPHQLITPSGTIMLKSEWEARNAE
jgi:hypothetical protein